jgi:hypothetical protein
MQYGRFISYNVLGGLVWGAGMPLAGYYLGSVIPDVDKYLLPIVLGIILVSVSPIFMHILRDPEERALLLNILKRIIHRPTYYSKVVKFVTDAFEKVGKTGSLVHLERTVYWVKHFKSGADEALCIAAFSHDIERAFRNSGEDAAQRSEQGFKDDFYLHVHPDRGAQIMGDFLEREHAPRELIVRVIMLISGHEVGGNDDQNLLKDADSVSFFENNVSRFAKEKVREVGKAKVQEKFTWTFERITSTQAKEIARPWYEQSMKEIV